MSGLLYAAKKHRMWKMSTSKFSDVRAQVEAKKAVPKEEHPSGRAFDSSNPQRTKKIFVGGLAPSVDESVLKGYFERFGEVRRPSQRPSCCCC